jgi:hypothetical protein
MLHKTFVSLSISSVLAFGALTVSPAFAADGTRPPKHNPPTSGGTHNPTGGSVHHPSLPSGGVHHPKANAPKHPGTGGGAKHKPGPTQPGPGTGTTGG